MQTLVLIDDALMPLEEAKVGVNDRGYLFGDSIYEVIASRQGKTYFSQDHLNRLRVSATGVYMDIPWDDNWFKKRIRKGLDALNIETAYVRIIVSRGSGGFDISFGSLETGPKVTFIFKPAPQYKGRFEEEGFNLATPQTRRNTPRSLNPAYKTGNYLNNILCLEEARRLGADDALILDHEGHVTELSTSNFFIVKDGELWTAPLEVGILDGITRQYLIQTAEKMGLKVHQKHFKLADVFAADEAFVSSTIKGAMPVCKVNEHTFPKGYGSVTWELNHAYWAFVDSHLDTF